MESRTELRFEKAIKFKGKNRLKKTSALVKEGDCLCGFELARFMKGSGSVSV